MTIPEHPGFPPKYWQMLADAGKEMAKEEACSDCMMKWRSHGPAHYRAIKNVDHCGACAIRAALPVEKMLLDWQCDHDPLRIVVKKIVDAYRDYRKTRQDFKDIMRNWDKHLESHKREGLRHPSNVRDERIEEDIAAAKAFWQAVGELDGMIPQKEE